MGSITESVGSGRTNVRRYTSIQTRLQQCNHGSSTAELPTHLQKIRTHGTRTPALDLAQQAQLAACNYLGYSPRDLPNALFCQQTLPSDGARSLELHMHHFHHHYVGSPTSPFSQTSSQCCGGPVGEMAGAPTTDLAIRVGSPVQVNPPSTSKAIYPAMTATVYPSLGLRAGSSISTQLISSLPGCMKNSSQSLLNGTSPGDVEAAQRYMKNILWLKNQIDHGHDQTANHRNERRGETLVGTESKSMGRELTSGSGRRPIRRTRKILWPRDEDDSDDSSDGELTSERGSKLRPTTDSALLLEKCEKMRAIRRNNSPCHSFSEDNSVTDFSARSGSLPPKGRRNPNVRITMRTTKTVENGGTPTTLETSDLKLYKSEGAVRSAHSYGCPPWSLRCGQDPKLSRERNSDEDTSSSMENDSVCSSGKVSVQKSTLTGTSSYTEIDVEQKERSSPRRPAKKNCGARVARQQAYREARAWESNERNPQKTACRTANTRLKASKEPICMYEMGSECKTEEQDEEDVHSQMADENSSLRDTSVEEKERRGASNSRGDALMMQTRLQTEVQPSRTSGPNRGLHRISIQRDTNGMDEQRLGQPHSCLTLRTIESKTGDDSSQNRLKVAVEAAWNTNLGTKRGTGDDCVKASSGHTCDDLQNTGNGEPNFPCSAEGKVNSCDASWKVRSGLKTGSEEEFRNKVYADPLFQNIYRDHENLKALVAREESLQRELKDQTVARVAAEEKTRVAAEQKAHLYEASAKAAEEGLRVLLNERAVFHCKFQEELEKGATDRLRLQELLHLEKLKLEATERELREVRRSFQDSLAMGTRPFPSKNSLQDRTRLDELSDHGPGTKHDDARLQLMAESERRIAAESRASYFEESAQAAEDRLRGLLEERNWFYSKFKEELEQNNTDMKKLQQLMELEKSNDGHAESPQKRKQEMISPDGEHNAMHFRASFHSRDEEMTREDQDRQRLKPSSEYEETSEERAKFYRKTRPKISGYRQAEEEFGEDQKSISSIDIYENRDVLHVKASHETKSMKNEKKRPLSPMNGSRASQWKSPDGLSIKVGRCNGGPEETTTVDISPGESRLDSVDLHFQEIQDSPNDSRLEAKESFDLNGNKFDSRKSGGLSVKNCREGCTINGGQPILLPSKWKKETKAELRKMIQEQEMTWKIAEDAVEELGRRLELLERYKMEIQDTLGRTRVMGNMDCFFKRLKENLEEFPRGFNSFYKSPIYDEGKSLYNCPILKGGVKTKISCQNVCTSPTRPDISKDSEIKKLKVELAQLRCELQRRESNQSNSPKLENTSQICPGSSDSSSIPTTPVAAAVPDWSHPISSSLKTRVNKEETLPLNQIDQGNPSTAEEITEEMKPELLDHSFKEMKTITIQATPNGSEAHSNGKVDRFQHNDVYDVEARGWLPTPDEKLQTMSPAVFVENGNCQMEKMDCKQTSLPGQDIFLSIDLNADEDELQVLRTAVRKLSQIFWEQEEKLKTSKLRERKEEDKPSQAETEELRNLYLGMLKEMSQQLGQLCCHLHALSQSREALHKEERTTRNFDPMEQRMPNFQSMEIINGRVSDAEVAEVEHANKTLLSTCKPEFGEEKLLKGAEVQPQDGMSESANLQASLKAAEKKIEEQMSTNQSLAEKLESGSQYLSRLRATHAQEVAKKDESIKYIQQLNFDLKRDMTQTETSLVEIKSRYRSLVSNLEQQLEEARKEAESLKNAVLILKEEIAGKENLLLNLEAEAKEPVLQMEELRSQLEAIQKETEANTQEKVELQNNLDALRSEIDQQQRHITELISINEELIEFSQTKEDEIKELTTTLKGLEQRNDEMSAEAAKLSAEAVAFSQEAAQTRKEGEIHHLRCTALQTRLQELECELRAREASLERLTQHLGNTIEGQDIILEEKEQLLLSLNRAQYKEHRLDDQVRQSKIMIQDLEEKLSSMDVEVNEARLEMAEMKSKGLEALLMEEQAEEMRTRVYELEEEIMEKEGQISILKTSYPGEYASAF